jgi:hypothetical protein
MASADTSTSTTTSNKNNRNSNIENRLQQSDGRWQILHDRVVYENGTEWIDQCSCHDPKQMKDRDMNTDAVDVKFSSNNKNEYTLQDSHQRTLIQFVAQWISE